MHQAADIYTHTDYRGILRDFHESRKRTRSGWSLTSWSRRLGLKSHSALVMILGGKRNPSPELTARLARVMELDAGASSYFAELVELEKAKDDARISVLLMEKIAQRQGQRGILYLDFERFQAISHWHYYAIRELVSLPDFRENPGWIANRLRFKVTPQEVSAAIRRLLKLGLLNRRSDGKLQSTDATFDTPTDISDEGIKRFHEQTLDHAKQTLRTVPTGQREFYALTLAMPHSKMPQAKALVRKFTLDFLRLMEEPSDAVYQMQVSLFPLTRVLEPNS